MEKLSCAQAKQLDMVEYLASLGCNPQKIKNHDHWYFSPFRKENTPSFKVNKKLNVWFDFGEGQGGDLIDFGVRFYNCSINEFLKKLSGQSPTLNFSFHPPDRAGEKKETTEGKILILDTRRLAARPLLQYLKNRCIPVEIAERFCREVNFLLYDKKYIAIGFQNSAGGYELRNQYFKGSSSPKDVTFFNNGHTQKITVFEGFFNYLSFHSIHSKQLDLLTNFLVLNSLSFFEKSKEIMEKHKQVHLFLDRDVGGKKCTQLALQWDKEKYVDRSQFYKNRKDLNEWLINEGHDIKQTPRIRRHF